MLLSTIDPKQVELAKRAILELLDNRAWRHYEKNQRKRDHSLLVSMKGNKLQEVLVNERVPQHFIEKSVSFDQPETREGLYASDKPQFDKELRFDRETVSTAIVQLLGDGLVMAVKESNKERADGQKEYSFEKESSYKEYNDLARYVITDERDHAMHNGRQALRELRQADKDTQNIKRDFWKAGDADLSRPSHNLIGAAPEADPQGPHEHNMAEHVLHVHGDALGSGTIAHRQGVPGVLQSLLTRRGADAAKAAGAEPAKKTGRDV